MAASFGNFCYNSNMHGFKVIDMQPHELIRNRLRQELEKRNLSAVELARSAGVKTSFIYDILNGKSTNPSTVKLAQVADTLGINLAWLAGSATHEHAAHGHPPATADFIAIPHVAGGEAAPVHFSRPWLRETLRVRPENLRMATLSGDGMAPTILNGDTVLIDTTSLTPTPGGIYVLTDGAALVAKRLEYAGGEKSARLRVISDNPRYGAYEQAASETRIVGRIVWLARQP